MSEERRFNHCTPPKFEDSDSEVVDGIKCNEVCAVCGLDWGEHEKDTGSCLPSSPTGATIPECHR